MYFTQLAGDFGEFFLANLRYKILMDSIGSPVNLTLSLMNSDSNPKRLLNVCDSIIRLPNLEISAEAQVQVKQINSLRSEKFDVSRYLSLPNNNCT